MPLVIGIPKESTPGETRIALVPEVAKKLKSLGAKLCVERGAGASAHLRDEDFGADELVGSTREVYERSQLVFKVRAPSEAEVALMKPGTVVVGFMAPYQSRGAVEKLAAQKVTSFAIELVPRISRAQAVDGLSSQASVAGYQAALIGASLCPRFFPMLTTAAGTIRPARVLVIGAGVAGLQAIATCKRLGAIVEGYDVRAAAKEQVESLGAKFVDTGVSAEGQGGYARELTAEEKQKQQDRLAKAAAQADVIITTAAIPGKKSPEILTEAMVKGLKLGAVVVDMAAEGGGNCCGTKAGETVVKDGVTIVGPVNLPARMPVHASEMYSKNLFNFFSPFIKDGNLNLDWADEIVTGSALTHDGVVKHEGVRRAYGEAR